MGHQDISLSVPASFEWDHFLKQFLGPIGMSKHIVVDEENITGRHGLNSFDNLLDGAETKFMTPELAYGTVLAVVGTATGRFHDVSEGIPPLLEKIKRRSG